MIGHADPVKIVADAAIRFRSIRLSQLTEHDLLTSEAEARSDSATLFDRTETCALGEVDAFVSHSWSDDPTAKWAALEAWCISFRRAHGREPRLWIDKACINQKSIEESLVR